MNIIHKSNLDEFLEEIQAGICCGIKEASDTHFSRVYINLLGINASNRQLQVLLGGYQNFVSDLDGRQSSMVKAVALFQQLKKEMDSLSIEMEKTPVFSIGKR